MEIVLSNGLKISPLHISLRKHTYKLRNIRSCQRQQSIKALMEISRCIDILFMKDELEAGSYIHRAAQHLYPFNLHNYKDK